MHKLTFSVPFTLKKMHITSFLNKFKNDLCGDFESCVENQYSTLFNKLSDASIKSGNVSKNISEL